MGYDMHRVQAGPDKGDYFHLNIWGMSTAIRELEPVGVVRHVNDPVWPRLAEFGLDGYPDEEADPATLSPSEVEYLGALDRVRCGVPQGDCAGIAVYKFRSNDGWLVTPGEIATSLAWADHHQPGWRDQLTDFVRSFVEWMAQTAPYGGFEVH